MITLVKEAGEWGGFEVDFHFFIVSDRGEWQQPGIFYIIKKLLSLAKVIALSNLKNTYNYFARKIFNR